MVLLLDRRTRGCGRPDGEAMPALLVDKDLPTEVAMNSETLNYHDVSP
jgi:hypothetical protein